MFPWNCYNPTKMAQINTIIWMCSSTDKQIRDVYINGLWNTWDTVAIFLCCVIKVIHSLLSLFTDSALSPSLPQSPQWAVHWRTKGLFHHVFRSVALFSSLRLLSVAWQRTFSNQPWHWWNASGGVQELQLNTQWWECWLRLRVCVCLCVND